MIHHILLFHDLFLLSGGHRELLKIPVHLILSICDIVEELGMLLSVLDKNILFYSFLHVTLLSYHTPQDSSNEPLDPYSHDTPFYYASYPHNPHFFNTPSYGTPSFTLQTTHPYEYPKHFLSNTACLHAR